MNKGLEKLRKKRRKWVDANRENGFEEGIHRLLSDLYPDNAHFIYELLQNAEDTRASEVRFRLRSDAIEFEHNGKRLFNIRDVQAITSIGTSTKRDDPTSIGKFGVGFKAVFAYTRTPEVHSGNYHFRIRDLVVPETDGVERPHLGDRETRFVIPFNHPAKAAAQAVKEVERALRALGDNTLLFLKHIRAIEYQLPAGSTASLERISHKGGRIEIRVCRPGGEREVSHWLRFQKEVTVSDETGEPKTLRIAIAYHLEPKLKSRRKWKVVPLERGQVSIYFPAEKETSNLRFHIHAPFASTVARDSVRDCEANRQLRDRIAELVVESLEQIRDRGMLTADFLAVLPNPEDNIPPFYEPIRAAAVLAFKNSPLAPTKSGDHARSDQLFRGPQDISSTLSDSDLSILTARKGVRWAAEPRSENKRVELFFNSLGVEEFEWPQLIETLSVRYAYMSEVGDFESAISRHKRRIERWLETKDDKWITRYYALLGKAWQDHPSYVDEESFEDYRVVRVQSGESRLNVTPKEAFFQPKKGMETHPGVYFVELSGRSKRLRELATLFLKKIGVRQFDEKAVVELKLKDYFNPPLPNQDFSKHYQNIAEFITYWKRNKNETSIFNKPKFLLGTGPEGDLEWCSPADLCLDLPYEETGLAELVHIHGKRPLADLYSDNLPDTQPKDFVAFAKAVGVMHALEVVTVTVEDNPRFDELVQVFPPGVRTTRTALNCDFIIPDIQLYLKARSITASRLIWNTVIRTDPSHLTALYRPNQQYQTSEVESQLVYYLKEDAWIPDKSGKFRRPQEMTRDDLREDFPYDDRNGLLTAIGFGQHASKNPEGRFAEAAKALGFDSSEEAKEARRLIKEIKKKGATPEEFLRTLTQHRPAAPPGESAPDPKRRRERVRERSANAPSKESVVRERKTQQGLQEVVARAKAYLRSKYTNPDGQLVCQCCHEEMPFKIRGEYYFEAVQCVLDPDRRHHENYLALCPTCAAMYKHARETSDEAIRRAIIKREYDNAPAMKIAVRLAERNFQLRFVGTHFIDLQAILEDPSTASA